MRDTQDVFELIGFVLSEGDDDAVRALMRAISDQCARDDFKFSAASLHPKRG
ncbi:hypothetical protein [Methylorubrum thiocyanatum]|uniref:hypothetical protein n=1 Tax=Methylorubrum thiocyanatum TaxID=47958 RepID=UPI003649E423